MKRLLATRQPEDNEILSKNLQHKGWQVLGWPALVIEKKPLNNLGKSFQTIDIVIFTSKNSIRKDLFNLIDIKTKQIVCIGKATAKKLFRETGLVADTPFKTTTEGLLEMDLLETNNKNVLIVKGEGGRDLLEEELTKRQNKVLTLNVYSRKDNVLTKKEAEKINEFDAEYVLATSIECLRSIQKKIDYGLIDSKIFTKGLISFSERINNFAKKIGFVKTHTVKKMSNEGIIDLLVGLK